MESNSTVYTTTSPPSTNCFKRGYFLYFHNENTTGPLVVPRVEQVGQIYMQGDHPFYLEDPAREEREARFLSIDGIEFPDLMNVTNGGVSIG
jgi:hypothetical protein